MYQFYLLEYIYFSFLHIYIKIIQFPKPFFIAMSNAAVNRCCTHVQYCLVLCVQ